MAARRLAAAAALTCVTLLLWSPLAVAAPSPSPSPGQPDPTAACRNLPPSDPSRLAVRLACDAAAGGPAGPVQDVQRSAGQAAAQVGQAATAGAEVEMTSWLVAGAVWLLQSVARKVLESSTTPSLDPSRASAFAQVYGRVAGVALALSMLLVLIGVIEATFSRRPGGLRRVVVGIVVSGVCVGAVPAVTATLMRIVDDLSLYVWGGQTQVVPQGLVALSNVLVATDPATGAATFAMTALGILAGGALLWVELVTRESLVYLFVGIAPLACAAVQWPRLEGVLRQVLFVGLALILSKLVIAVALAVGFSILASGSGLETLLGGMFVIAIAALSPFATARVLPLAAAELTEAHQGRIRGWASRGAVSVVRNVAAIATGSPAGLGAVVGLASVIGGARRGGVGPGSQGANLTVAAGAAAGQRRQGAVQPTRRAAAQPGRPGAVRRRGGRRPPETGVR